MQEPPVVIAEPFMSDYVRCESCNKRIKKGQPIRRWADGIRTHEDC